MNIVPAVKRIARKVYFILHCKVAEILHSCFYQKNDKNGKCETNGWYFNFGINKKSDEYLEVFIRFDTILERY